jgi:hypothetical protein
LLFNNWTNATVSGNLFAPRLQNAFVVGMFQALTGFQPFWDYNTYVCLPGGNEFFLNSLSYGFSGWQAVTGCDRNSIFVMGDLHGTRVFVRPNLYEPGRANIVVYNWDNLDNVTVSIGSMLPVGWGFEVRNAQDIHAPPLLRGVFNGQLLQLPMTNLTVAVPNGPMVTPPPTGPTFNAFVVLPHQNKLQITLTNQSVQLRWPVVNSGTNVLQYTYSPALSGTWTECTNASVVTGDQFQCTDPVNARAKFYRLRPGP